MSLPDPAALEAALRSAWVASNRDFPPRIENAIRFAERAHAGQTRASGEPYITHPLTVAIAACELGLDEASIAAAVLHDVVEDCAVDLNDLADAMGADVASLVDGVTKVDRIRFDTDDEARAATTLKMLIAVAGDVRVLLIKLADRLHNMRTLSALTHDKQVRISGETMNIYAPLAHRLGLSALAGELEDLAFSYLHAEQCTALSRALATSAPQREAALEAARSLVEVTLADAGINATIQARHKRLWSIWEKMQTTGANLEEIKDLVGLRVLTATTEQCYQALGCLHQLFPPIPDTFSDYIALRKINGYQSLHTSLLVPPGTPIEVQIRTRDMHEVAEHGVAAHFAYKEDRANPTLDEDLTWMSELLDRVHVGPLQDPSSRIVVAPEEFFANLVRELSPTELYVFTPKARVIHLPQGATALDFAYAIHTDIGDHATGALINATLSSLRAKLTNGDTVEIITNAKARPRRDWIAASTTGRARSRIRRALKAPSRAADVEAGSKALAAALRSQGRPLTPHLARELLSLAQLTDLDDLKIAIARGKYSADGLLADALLEAGEPLPLPTSPLDYRLARCCSPTSTDTLVAYPHRAHVVLHRTDCPTYAGLAHQPPPIDAEHVPLASSLHPEGFLVALLVISLDRTGLLRDCTAVFLDLGISIDSSISGIGSDRLSRVVYEFSLADPEHLNALIESLEDVASVVSVERVPLSTQPRPL